MPGQLLVPEKWVGNYADKLFAYAMARVNDRAVAEDLVQETFLSAWKAKDTFKGEASEKSWLYSICKNKIIDHYRKKARDIIQPASLQEENHDYFDEAGHWTDSDGPGDSMSGAAGPLENKEFYEILAGCRNKLQEMQKAVFVMKYMEDLNSAEICKALGITPSNYWVLMHRAKLQLRACLEKNWG